MTRTGKIARLPNDLRDHLNRRLRDGEKGKTLLKWLNALPEVRALLAAESKPLARWSRLREISTDVSRLLRGHLWTERISLERERFDAHEQRLAIERQRELAERLQKAQSAGRILERLFSELKASEKTRRPKKNKPSREPADPASPPAPSSSDDQSDPPSSAPEPGPVYQQS